MFGLFAKAEKPLYRCKMMERISCDLDSALSNPKPRSDEHCEIIAETDKYLFYRYNAYEDNSGGYIVRREKGRPSRMVFFGNNTRMVCFFKGYLFQCNHVGPREKIGIFAKQINTGKTFRFDWLGQGELRVWRLPDVIDSYVQDTINDMTVEGDELVFNITRLRSEEKGLDDKYNIDMDYVLKVSFTGGKFVPKAYYSLEKYNSLYSEKVSSHWMPRLAFKDPREWKARDAKSNKTNIDDSIKTNRQLERANDSVKTTREESIKKQGDVEASQKNYDEAIRNYKRATFADPTDAAAWCGLAKMYEQKAEYNNALSAVDKALSVAPENKDALFIKARILYSLQKADDALAILDALDEQYSDGDIKEFKDKILAEIEPAQLTTNLETAISLMTEKAFRICMENELLNDEGGITLEKEINQMDDFVKGIMTFCRRQYSPFGEDKIWSESIIAAYYGSLAMTLMYYKDPEGFVGVTPFQYLSDHADLEGVERKAENLMGDLECNVDQEELWDIIYQYVTYCRKIIAMVMPENDRDAVLRDACESAYSMGMLLAMREQEAKKTNESAISLEERVAEKSLAELLTKLDESAKVYKEPDVGPNTVFMYTNGNSFSSYDPYRFNSSSLLLTNRYLASQITFICDDCGRQVSLTIYGRNIITNSDIQLYRGIADKYSALGYPSKVNCYCDNCAKNHNPVSTRLNNKKNNIMFSFGRPGCDNPIISYPTLNEVRSPDPSYTLTLSFLEGAHTCEQLSATFFRDITSKEILFRIHKVVGN